MLGNGTRLACEPRYSRTFDHMRYLERAKVAVLAACPAYRRISAQGRREEYSDTATMEVPRSGRMSGAGGLCERPDQWRD